MPHGSRAVSKGGLSKCSIVNRWVVYYHSYNRHDRMYDEGWTVSNDFDFDFGYEDRDIKCLVDTRGVA